MQTITLHLRSSLKQRNSYAPGESVETESLHQHTQEDNMSKNAYEIRLETLRMAKEMADSKYCLQQDIMYRMIDQAMEKREDIEKAIRAHAPLMYRPSDIIEKANELYQYVSEKQ